MVEPGSTFKIVVVSAALNEGLVTLTDTFDCENGQFYYYKTLLRDHERYGVLTVERHHDQIFGRTSARARSD